MTMRRLAVTALVVGGWSYLPAFSGPPLATAVRVEFADHVVPGTVVIVIAVATLFLAPRQANAAPFLLVAGLGVLLAGFWMTATHAPLVVQAMRDQAPWGATAYHSVPGVVVFALGAVWSAGWWSEGTADQQAPDRG